MASNIPPCSLKNKLASGAWDDSDFVSNEFRNPKIGNMNGSRHGILVEEEQLSGNAAFGRGGGGYCPLSDGDCKGPGGPGTADSILWGNLGVSGNSGSVRQNGDSCYLSNSDFEGPEADFVIEGSGLRGNWKDGEDFMVDYLGSKIRIDCTTVLLAIFEWMNTLHAEHQNFEENPCYRREIYHGLMKGMTNKDSAIFPKSQSIPGSNCVWYPIQTCPAQHKATPCNPPFNLNELTGHGDYETICWDTIEKTRVQHRATTCPAQHKATPSTPCNRVPYLEPFNLNEFIGHGDYETICWDNIEKTRFQHRATTGDLASCYEDYEPVNMDELRDKIELVDELRDKIELADPSYKGVHLPCLNAGGLLGNFQGSGEAGLSRQLEESNDRWQESPPKNRDGTDNIQVQAALGDLSTALGGPSMKISAYYESYQINQGETKTVLGSMECCSDGELHRGEPHYGLLLTLPYLGLQDLMSVEKVCKSLHAAVKNDPFWWTSIHVEHPLSQKLTDDALLKLSKRSQGHLRNLSLVECLKITDDGLKQVLDISPKLTKLCLPGCTRLTADGIVKNVKAHKECSMIGLNQLRIRGLFGITREHLEKLNYLLDGGLQQKSQSVKPRFYPQGHHNGRYNAEYFLLSYDDDNDSTIDIEACPKCGNARLVYDCTDKNCQNQTDHTMRGCRACIFCIARCDECGRCITGSDYEETFCLRMLCADCAHASQLP